MDLSAEASKRNRGLRILVTRLRFLGDVIISTAAVALLRKRYPEASIYYLTEAPYADILEENPHIEGIIRLEKGARGYLRALGLIRSLHMTAAIDLFHNPTSANLLFLSGIPIRIGGRKSWRRRLYTHPVSVPPEVRSAVSHHIHMMKSAGCEGGEMMPRVYLADGERDAGRRTLEGLMGAGCDSRRKVAFHPGGTWQSKRWPESHYSRLGDAIGKELGASVLLIAGPGEEKIAERVAASCEAEVNILPSSPVRQTASVLAACDAVVANDGGMMHLSVALGIPTVGIFGPTERDIWFPYEGKGPFALASMDRECAPCHLHDCDDKSCLEDLDPSEVMSKLRKATGW